jgi:hypothetical protein
MCCGEIVTLALRLSFLVMHLVKSRQAALWAACRRLSTGAVGEDCGLLHPLRRTTWLVQLVKVRVSWLALTSDENGPTGAGPRTARHALSVSSIQFVEPPPSSSSVCPNLSCSFLTVPGDCTGSPRLCQESARARNWPRPLTTQS